MTPLHIVIALWIRTMLNRMLCASIAIYALGTKGTVRLEYKDSSSSFLLEAKDKVQSNNVAGHSVAAEAQAKLTEV